ncbi:hypothetical protein Ppb6_04285 [Photorhabdus australis subsp. thailandensis]|uniref:Uncharacterized protein n=1 Tax=Photorhabdus australis subsp. thailandensis TaxID=2805096 RepID=A0A1C0TXW0_9GAMM|nr:hypothetical protein Ppb6_04285 [Photorhabdus australis subsp. thailandensis]
MYYPRKFGKQKLEKSFRILNISPPAKGLTFVVQTISDIHIQLVAVCERYLLLPGWAVIIRRCAVCHHMPDNHSNAIVKPIAVEYISTPCRIERNGNTKSLCRRVRLRVTEFRSLSSCGGIGRGPPVNR